MKAERKADHLTRVHAAIAAGLRGNTVISTVTGVPYNSVASNKVWISKADGDLDTARLLRNRYHRSAARRYRRMKEAGER